MAVSSVLAALKSVLRRGPLTTANDGTARGGAGHVLLQNSLMLAGGAGAARAVGLLATPILSRIYTPSDFGVASIFMAVVSVLLPLATLRYSQAVPLVRRDEAAINLFVACLGILALTVSVIALLVFLFGPLVLPAIGAGPLLPYAFMIPVSVAAFGLYEVLFSWVTRRRSFAVAARSQLPRAVINAAVRIALGFLGVRPFGLILGYAMQLGAGIVPLARLFGGDLAANARHLRWRRISFLLRHHIDLPVYRLPSQLLLATSTQLFMLVFAAMFDQHSVGQLSMALTTIALPASLVGQAVGQAYFAEVSRIGRRQPRLLSGISLLVLRRLSMIGVPLALSVAIAAPLSFAWLLGREWQAAGWMCTSLSPYLLAEFVISPLIGALSVLKRNFDLLALNAFRLVLLAIWLLLVKWLSLDGLQAITLYSGMFSIYYGLTGLWVFAALGRTSDEQVGAGGTSHNFRL